MAHNFSIISILVTKFFEKRIKICLTLSLKSDILSLSTQTPITNNDYYCYRQADGNHGKSHLQD